MKNLFLLLKTKKSYYTGHFLNTPRTSFDILYNELQKFSFEVFLANSINANANRLYSFYQPHCATAVNSQSLDNYYDTNLEQIIISSEVPYFLKPDKFFDLIKDKTKNYLFTEENEFIFVCNKQVFINLIHYQKQCCLGLIDTILSFIKNEVGLHASFKNSDTFTIPVKSFSKNPYKFMTTVGLEDIDKTIMSEKECLWYELYSKLPTIDNKFSVQGYRRLTYYDTDLYKQALTQFIAETQSLVTKKPEEAALILDKLNNKTVSALGQVFSSYGMPHYLFTLYLENYSGVVYSKDKLLNEISFKKKLTVKMSPGHGALLPCNILYNQEKDLFAYINPNMDFMTEDLLIPVEFDKAFLVTFSEELHQFFKNPKIQINMGNGGAQSTINEAYIRKYSLGLNDSFFRKQDNNFNSYVTYLIHLFPDNLINILALIFFREKFLDV